MAGEQHRLAAEKERRSSIEAAALAKRASSTRSVGAPPRASREPPPCDPTPQTHARRWLARRGACAEDDFAYTFEAGVEAAVKAFRQRGGRGDALIIKVSLRTQPCAYPHASPRSAGVRMRTRVRRAETRRFAPWVWCSQRSITTRASCSSRSSARACPASSSSPTASTTPSRVRVARARSLILVGLARRCCVASASAPSLPRRTAGARVRRLLAIHPRGRARRRAQAVPDLLAALLARGGAHAPQGPVHTPGGRPRREHQGGAALHSHGCGGPHRGVA